MLVSFRWNVGMALCALDVGAPQIHYFLKTYIYHVVFFWQVAISTAR